MVLPKHIYELWPHNTQFLPMSKLIDLLATEHPTVWGEEGPFGKRLTAHRLGRMLAQGYKIHSTREVRGGPRGYIHSDFTRLWTRMRIPTHQSDATVQAVKVVPMHRMHHLHRIHRKG